MINNSIIVIGSAVQILRRHLFQGQNHLLVAATNGGTSWLNKPWFKMSVVEMFVCPGNKWLGKDLEKVEWACC